MFTIAVRAVRAVIGVLALFVVMVAAAAPAQAAGGTCQPLTVSGKNVTVCVEFDGSGRPYGLAGYESPQAPSRFWVGLYQCNNSSGPECVLISANDKFVKIGANKYQVKTSSKPYSFGHTYKACTTVTNVVANHCTRTTT